LRLTLGVNIFLHGFVRLWSGLNAFADSLVPMFAGTPLPAEAVRGFAYALPFAEVLVGALLTLGLWVRYALAAGGLVIAALVFGTALRSDWETLGIQMVYALVYYLLLANVGQDAYGLDALLGRATGGPPEARKTFSAE
jgi:thiosulfate dehydrogenase [quinone] large subunit